MTAEKTYNGWARYITSSFYQGAKPVNTSEQLYRLTETELRVIVARTREALWPNEDPDCPWTPDTTQEIADILGFYGLLPDSKEQIQ